MKNLFLLLALSLSALVCKGQYFIPELSTNGAATSKGAYTVTNAGDTVRGKLGGFMLMMGQMRSFTIKQEDGTKSKFKAADVKVLAVKPSKLANLESAMSVANIGRAGELNFDKTINREWVYYEQALLPKKKDKYALMQLLNPGFDTKIKVYLDPNANQTGGLSAGGIKLTGGDDKSYLVVFDGGKSELYKKSRYKKEALGQLYKDCTVFKENYSGEKFKWVNFAEHVFVYDQLCN